MQAALTGFLTGIGLILAIGAQNAFVLRQGLLRAHVLPVVLTCAVSDALLIVAGVVGMGALTSSAPWVIEGLRWGGVVFLLAYGLRAFRSALTGGAALRAAEAGAGTLSAALLTCMAFTWLNPHVYLDTVVLIGSISAQWPGREALFGAGAVAASFAFFFSLGYGARLLAPVFERPSAWRVLDTGIGLLMWAIAAKLMLL